MPESDQTVETLETLRQLLYDLAPTKLLRAFSSMHFHGTADEFAPFGGGFGKGFLGRNGITKFRSVDHTTQKWVKANGCNNEPEITPLPDKADDGMKVIRKTWSRGIEDSEVVLIEIEGAVPIPSVSSAQRVGTFRISIGNGSSQDRELF